jgi:Mce-associated membrane protein
MMSRLGIRPAAGRQAIGSNDPEVSAAGSIDDALETSRTERDPGDDGEGRDDSDAHAGDTPRAQLHGEHATPQSPNALADSTDAQIDSTSGGVSERRDSRAARVAVLFVLPLVVMVAAGLAGFTRWQADTLKDGRTAAVESVQAATDITVKMLSYRPDTVEQDLGAARDWMTGTFRDNYTKLTHDVVIPGAKQKKISAVATVPGAASISANPDHAVVLVLVNQTTLIGADAPVNTASSVKVTLDKVHDRWLISQFDPV